MSNTRPLINDNPRVYRANSVPYLIVTGLGYCCVNFFFKHYSHLPSPLIAARLGVSPDTIRHYKQWWREGEFHCEERGNCMKSLTSQSTSK